MKIIAVVGMPGSGKSEAVKVFEENGFSRIRFGDITDEELKKRGLPVNEANEKTIREALRRELGMAAYAILNKPKIDKLAKISRVVLDGLYSWEEYLALKASYNKELALLAVYASPATRYFRLKSRLIRPLTAEEAAARDKAEIENLNKGGPIAMADYTVVNDSSIGELRKQTQRIINELDE